jgi:hypothetical protein
MEKTLEKMINKTLNGTGDSDRHLISLFSIALASKGKTYIELGVREGHTTEPLLEAAKLNNGHLWSVDIELPTVFRPSDDSYTFVRSCALEFLKNWPKDKKIDFIYIDDWHSYSHVKQELEYIDQYVGPSSIILLHDLMYGNTEPFYHSDLTLSSGQWAEGGPYRAVAELDSQFWEWATLPWNNGLTILRKKYSNKYHRI